MTRVEIFWLVNAIPVGRSSLEGMPDKERWIEMNWTAFQISNKLIHMNTEFRFFPNFSSCVWLNSSCFISIQPTAQYKSILFNDNDQNWKWDKDDAIQIPKFISTWGKLVVKLSPLLCMGTIIFYENLQ